MKRFFAILLAAVLLLSLVGCIRISCSAPVRYSHADKYTAGNFTYEGSKVKKVEIEWASGGITLQNGKGTLSVTENGGDTLPEEEQMHWWLDGTTLRIKFCKSGFELPIRDLNKKDLTVELPDFVDLEIDVASGKVSAEHMLNLGTFELKTASGGADIKYLSAKEVKVESASGKLALGKLSVSDVCEIDTASGGLAIDEISANTLKIDSASGGVDVGLRMAEEVRIESVSGGVRIGLLRPEAGAAIEYSSVSGSFSCKLPYEKNGDTYTVGLGEIAISIKAVSGGVTVE